MNNKDNKNEYRSKTIKIAIISILSTLAFVAFLLLFVLFSLKNCAKESNASNISSSIKYDYDSELLDSKFKAIVNNELSFNGFEDKVNDIVMVTYVDNFPSNFSLSISCRKETNLYSYHLEEYEYPANISDYNNCVDYLLTINTNNRLDGSCSLERLETIEEQITTSKSFYKCVIGQSSTNSKYLFGYCYEENNYYVYSKKDYLPGTDPFINNPSKTITNQDPLFKYYQSLSI